MRCFLAIDLPQDVKDEIERVQRQLPEAKMKLVEKENLHLTLIFLDDLLEDKINKIKQEIMEIKFPVFKAKLGKIGIFPSKGFIRVVWVSLEPSEKFRQLHDLIYQKIKSIREFDKRFESHVTLARVKYLENKEKFLEKLEKIKCPEKAFEIKSFNLKKSTLTTEHPIYEDIINFELT